MKRAGRDSPRPPIVWPRLVCVPVAAGRSLLFLFRLLDDRALGREYERRDRGGVLERRACDLGRVDDPGLHHVDPLAIGSVEAATIAFRPATPRPRRGATRPPDFRPPPPPPPPPSPVLARPGVPTRPLPPSPPPAAGGVDAPPGAGGRTPPGRRW